MSVATTYLQQSDPGDLVAAREPSVPFSVTRVEIAYSDCWGGTGPNALTSD